MRTRESIIVGMVLLFSASVAVAQVSMSIGQETKLVITGEMNIAIAGDWQNDGGFVPDNGAVHFIGADVQQITGALGERFTHLTTNKSGGMLKLNTPVTVTGTFTFADGKIDNSSNTITLEKGADWILRDGVVHTTVSDVTLEELPSLEDHIVKKNIESAPGGTDPLTISTTSTVEVPKQFALWQNYPNPFNPSTEIKFSVEATDRATLDIYNVLGQKLATLFDDVAEPGQYYKVRFDGGNLASGVYFYRLASGRQSDLKKLLLLK